MKNPAPYFLGLALFSSLLAASVFLPGLSGSFVLDDGANIVQNRLLYINSLNIENLRNAALSFHDGIGNRPLPMLSFALDYWWAGSMDPIQFKLSNVLIHGITVFCLIFFLRRLLILANCTPQQAGWAALTLALVWGIHPLQVSSVLYVVQRMQTLVTLFMVLALWAYLGMRQVQLAGGRGRGHGLAVLLFWGLGLACKEDAALLPAYTLALELTVLHFRAAQPVVAKGLRQSYGVMAGLGLLIYLFVVIPYYWHWGPYPTRDFSSLERLLTQGRILVMYLWQMLFFHPDSMPFVYDTLPISRSLWQPWTTVPALLLLAALLSWAWHWRQHRPLFALGVFLFFAGHFMTSNVIALELAFEHRNQLPLIGIVLALGDLLRAAWLRWQWSRTAAIGSFSTLLLLLGTACLSHAHTWGDGVRHAEKLTTLHPDSPRAWTQLGNEYFERYKASDDKKNLQLAIDANLRGLTQIDSPLLAGNLIIYKFLQGNLSDSDWSRFLEISQSAPKFMQNKFLIWVLMTNVDRGMDIDRERVVDALEVVGNKISLNRNEQLTAAVFIYKSQKPERSLPFFENFVRQSRTDDPEVQRIMGELLEQGRADWVKSLEEVQSKRDAVKSSS